MANTHQAALEQIQALIGKELGVSDWIELTQEKFDTFGEITGDQDWLHNDPEKVKESGLYGGKTIAQGHLMLSHLSQIGEALMPKAEGIAYALNYGYDRVRVIRSVTVGSKIRGRLTVTEVRPKGDTAFIVKCDARIESDDSDKPAIVAEWLFYVQLA